MVIFYMCLYPYLFLSLRCPSIWTVIVVSSEGLIVWGSIYVRGQVYQGAPFLNLSALVIDSR
jgi:hypothetical protein